MSIIYLYLCISILAFSGVYLIYNLSRSKKKPRINSLYTDALNAMVIGDTSRAINLLKQVVKHDSNHVRAYLQLGNILRSDNPEQSLKIHQSLTVRPNLSSKESSSTELEDGKAGPDLFYASSNVLDSQQCGR